MRGIGIKFSEKIKKAVKIYRGLRFSGGYAPVPAFIHLLQSIFFAKFRKEEYGMMISYDFIYFKHPKVYQTLFTNKENAALQPAVNDQTQLFLLRQKHLLPGRLGDMGRRFLFVPQHSLEEVRVFLRKEGGYILKPDEGAASSDISFLYSDGRVLYVWDPAQGTRQTCRNLPLLYQEWQNRSVLIEDYIKQHSQLDSIFCMCVNTAYLHTVLLPNGQAELLDTGFITFGCGKSNFVNSGNQITIGIQPDGTLAPYGFIQKRDPYGCIHIEKTDRHPDTGVIFNGFKIPYWEDAKKLAVASAEKLPELTYIKWDIAIMEAGPVVIEGNGTPGTFGFWQTSSLAARKKGIKEDLSELFQAIAFSKTLTPEKIEAVNRSVSHFPAGCAPQDCDAVIVLGSTRCTSRIAAAFDTFGSNSDIQYILCGGCDSEHFKDPFNPDLGKLTEADYMQQYLMDRGVPPERISTDNASFSTLENLIHAKKMLHQSGIRKAAIVSAWFHGRRVYHLVSQLNRLGLSTDGLCFIPAYGEQTQPDNWVQSLYGIKAIYHEAQFTD